MPTRKKETAETPTFEQSVKSLKDIISKLEDDKTELNDAVDLFAVGVDALANCKEKLEITTAKITELKSGKNGKLVEKTLDL